jgi:hypothetical protein
MLKPSMHPRVLHFGLDFKGQRSNQRAQLGSCSAELSGMSMDSFKDSLGPMLSDTSDWRNKDQQKLMSRMVAVVSGPHDAQHARPCLRGILGDITHTANALFDESSSLAAWMKEVWDRDGQKGARALRKKAFTDCVKALTEIGAHCDLENTSRCCLVPGKSFLIQALADQASVYCTAGLTAATGLRCC